MHSSVQDTHYGVILFLLSLSSIPDVAISSGLSIFYCSFGISLQITFDVNRERHVPEVVDVKILKHMSVV